MRKKKGFTLIELLIVVAIIAILALIAVPNFLESQTRSKVSRCKADMRSLANGLEAYVTDWNQYPRGNNFHLAYPLYPSEFGNQGLVLLTTPIAYITSLFRDPFIPQMIYTGAENWVTPNAAQLKIMEYYSYSARDELGTVGTVGPPDNDPNSPGGTKWWVLQGSGPDRVRCTMGGAVLSNPDAEAGKIKLTNRIYDPTNGTVSFGSIYRVGGSPYGVGSFAFAVIGKTQ